MLIILSTDPPDIKTLPKTSESWINRTTELACAVEGVPAPAIYWSRPGQTHVETINRTHLTAKLVIIPRGSGDFGEYTCRAVNILGEQIRSTHLKELSKFHRDVLGLGLQV